MFGLRGVRVGVAAVFCGGRKCKKKTYRRTFARLQVLFDPLQSLRDSSAYARSAPLSFCDNSPVSGGIAPRGASCFVCVCVRSAAFVLAKTRSIGPLLRSLYSK